jgi:hypothetical protein
MPENTIKQDKPMYGSEQTHIKKPDTLFEIVLLYVKPHVRYTGSSNNRGVLFMKILNYALIIPCFLFCLSAFAEESPLKPQIQGDVTFVSGGIGEAEREALQTMKGDFNLNLLFAYKGSGEFMSDVNVRIADAKGNVFVETFVEGPYLFVNLKPGNYLISAVKDGNEIRQKAKIAVSKTTSLSFYWPLQPGIPGNP